MRPAVKVARIAGASRHSRLETEPKCYPEKKYLAISSPTKNNSLRMYGIAKKFCAYAKSLNSFPPPPKKANFKNPLQVEKTSQVKNPAQGDLGTNCIFSEVYAGRGKRKDFWASITKNGGVFALLQMIVSSLSLRLKKGETHLLR